MIEDFSRVDPDGCRCTDCLTGHSKPVDWLSDDDVDYAINGMLAGHITDASGLSEKEWNEL